MSINAVNTPCSGDLNHVLRTLREQITAPLNIMEVCGTHTVALLKFGFKSFFKDRINFLSGPGCPVCVTSPQDIDRIIALADAGVSVITFGDLLKAPGSSSSLAQKRAEGRRIYTVYNPLDALEIARRIRGEAAFIGIGFETTAPPVAALLDEIIRRKTPNLSLYTLLKTIPRAMCHLLSRHDYRIHGLICPGHVSAVIGVAPYDRIASDFRIPCVITGFEREDIAAGIIALIRQIQSGRYLVENAYPRVVKSDGNLKAREYIRLFFQENEAVWRGLGMIPESGLVLRPEFSEYHIVNRIAVEQPQVQEPEGCLCARIICGLNNPRDCRQFNAGCTPEHPLGPCMVSSEGSCHADYLYGSE
ncbi:MAG: hydrogenase formation protein HypD [Bacillota bacterium]